MALIIAVSALSGGLAQAAENPTVKAIVGGTVIDLDGNAPIRDAVIVIEGERIIAIGEAADVSVPDAAKVIDATGTWLIPGLMNMHIHLGLVLPGKLAAELANETEGALSLRMAANARDSLDAGVTTIRLTGEEKHADLALRNAKSLLQLQ